MDNRVKYKACDIHEAEKITLCNYSIIPTILEGSTRYLVGMDFLDQPIQLVYSKNKTNGRKFTVIWHVNYINIFCMNPD